jgi:ribosomal protein S18 acetylase RimI-like enzyme
VGAALLETVLAAAPGPLWAVVGEDDAVQLALFGLAGFTEARREDEVMVPVRTGPAAVPGLDLVPATEVDVAGLARLDERLRADVPGCAGWVTDPAELRDQFARPYFDPRTYLVAVAGGDLAGLVRVWRGREGVPRLGLVGVLPAYRRRGLATALLHRAFAPLAARGVPEVSAEVDAADTAAWALLRGFGAYRTGGTVELVLARAQPTKMQNGWPAGSA